MKTTLALALACLSLAATATAQNAVVVQKGLIYAQIDATGAFLSPIAQYDFHVDAQAAGTVTPPGQSAITLTSSGGGGYNIDQFFSTKSAFDAAFPNGTYQVTQTGSATASIPINGDLYPSVAPSVIGGTWQNNVLVVNAAQGATLNLSNFTGYSATANGQTGGHMSIEISANGIGTDTSTDLQQQYITASVQGLTQSATPFTSYTIAPNALKAGNLYQVNLSYDAVTYFVNATPLLVGLYDANNTFYISAQGATPPAAPPVVTTQPSNVTAPLGSRATISVATNPSFSSLNSGGGGNSSVIFQWLLNGQSINPGNGSTKYSFDQNFSITISNIAASDAGTYTLEIQSIGGITYSQSATLSIGAAAPPVITAQPANRTVTAGQSFSFTVAATGVGPFAYQWYLNGVAITNATGATYSFGSASQSQAGAYTVTVTNSGGTVTSTGATLTVAAAPSPPNITKQPQSQTVASGSTVVFNVTASGNPTPTYQWQYNGGPISGATSSRYVVSGANSASAGNYACIASNSQGQAISGTASLTITSTASPARLVNLSILSQINGSLTMGFVNGGSGTSGSEPFLIRAVGPSIGPGTVFNVPGVMSDPTLTVLQQSGSVTKASNSGWGSNSAAVIAADNATGAFALTNTASLDSAVVTSLPSVGGGYGAQVSGKTGDNGYALTEVYDNTTSFVYGTSPRLVNLSCLTNIAPGGSLNVGFVLAGANAAKTVLVRVSGPSIAVAPFNVPGTMPDPTLLVAPASTPSNTLVTNAGWGGDPAISSIAASLGAFAFTSSSSKDSAVLLTTPVANGGYSVTVTSASGAGGAVLVEVYEVP